MKRIAETSRFAFEAVRRTLQRREAEVLGGLSEYRDARGVDPTSYELLRWLQAANPAIDLNGIRPRLTALRDAGAVETTGKRACAVTGKRVFTWAVVSPRPQPRAVSPSAPISERLF